MNAASNCSVEFLTRYCQCLPDIEAPGQVMCGYVNRENGLVYPCEPGCCVPTCGPKFGHMPILGLEFRPSAGILPPNFNVNLQTSDNPTDTPGAVEFESSFEWMKREGSISWLTLFKLMLALMVIVLAALLLA